MKFDNGKVEKFVEDLRSMQVGAISVDYVIEELLGCVDVQKEAEISVFFETVWKMYPNKRGKSGVTAKAKKELMKAGLDNVKKAIQNYTNQKPSWANWLDGSTFFNGRWKDWINPELTSGQLPGNSQATHKQVISNFKQRQYDEDFLNSFIGGDDE